MRDRTTKYLTSIRNQMKKRGHATNAELLFALRNEYPGLSATTVHRVTARMIERGELQLAPPGKENVMRFDYNLASHDHFMCTECGVLRDASLGEVVRPLIENAIGDGCSISGSLTVSGVCKKCNKEKL